MNTNIAKVKGTDGNVYMMYSEPKRFKNYQGKMVDSSENMNVVLKREDGKGKKHKMMGNLPNHLLIDRSYFESMVDADLVIEWFLPTEDEVMYGQTSMF